MLSTHIMPGSEHSVLHNSYLEPGYHYPYFIDELHEIKYFVPTFTQGECASVKI